MADFKFNGIIVIESLDDNEPHTGKDLYDTQLVYMKNCYNGLFAEHKQVYDRNGFDKLFGDIADLCTNGLIPVLHFEIHGNKSRDGLVLKNGETVTVQELGDKLRWINQLTGFNLFVTMAVCHGLYTMFSLSPCKPAPFLGILGSFEEIYNKDLQLRFSEFYSEFFTSFDINKAYAGLKAANTGIPADYRCYMADEFFAKVYKRYLEEDCNQKAINKRADKCLGANNDRELKHRFQVHFKAQEIKNRRTDYEHFKRAFFMIARFPENELRFKHVDSIVGILNQSKKLTNN